MEKTAKRKNREQRRIARQEPGLLRSVQSPLLVSPA